MSRKLSNGQMFLAGLAILIVGQMIYHFDNGLLSLSISLATEIGGLPLIGLSIFRAIKNAFRSGRKRENEEYKKEKIIPINMVKNVSNERPRSLNPDKFLKLVVGLAIIIIAISFLFYLVVRPMMKESKLDNCIKKAEDMKVGFPDHRYDDESDEAKKECYKRYK